MWHNCPFSQRNKEIERAVEVGVGVDREGGKRERVGQNWNLKMGHRQKRGFLHKIGGLGPLCHLCCVYKEYEVKVKMVQGLQ